MEDLSCFKAYDIRGRIPDQLNEDIVYRIGRAYAEFLKPKRVVVGHDIRLTSEAFCEALSKGLLDSGVDVASIGMCGTEEIYFATSHLDMDGGIMVTASHNPRDYNGLKLVRENSKPISGDTGLSDIKALVEQNHFAEASGQGNFSQVDIKADYIEHLLGYVDVSVLKPFRIVSNPGNGGAGLIIDRIEQHLPFEFIKVHHEPDGNFPNGIPNPLLVENRDATANIVKSENADLGIAWDGDFDRCFFFDEEGNFIEGYYIVGLLAEAFLLKQPGSKIIHDPRLTWNTVETVEKFGGDAVLCKSGHAFIKEKMRAVDAAYGGEMSAHHYFRDFFYCDSGMIPWLLVAELMSTTGKTLKQLVSECMAAFPASGEINSTIDDPKAVLEKIQAKYEPGARQVDFTDGLSVDFDDWRFNLRMSNTEPVIRLNVESRADKALMEAKTEELLEQIRA